MLSGSRSKNYFHQLRSWMTGFVFLAPVIIIFRNGLNYWGYDYYALSWAAAWPEPLSVFSVENFGNLAIARLLDIDSRFGWVALHLVLTGFFFLLLIHYVNREQAGVIGKQSLFIVLLASPLSMMLMQEIGYFDVLTVIGALIIANATSDSGRILGAIVMASGNTPQALIATFIFCFSITLLHKTSPMKALMRFTPFVVVSLIWCFERIWLNGIGRTEEFGPGMWSYSFKGFLIASPLFLYSLLGPLVLLIPKIHARVGHSFKSREVLVISAFILIPGLFGIVTTESTRDALCIMAPTLFWYIRREIVSFGMRLTRWESVALCTLPCFLIWREGALVEPWAILHRLFF